ncbi:MAG: DUF2892 domain-containing protein [Bacteroidales bacterium]|jgi:hypothetical protein|nr:DUF2892 domain-containing protein [Bacteroidales bacterium]
MKKNIGTIDKAVRLVLAAIILLLYFTNVISGTLALVLIFVAMILTLTSLIGVCPFYIPFGINTISKKSQ